MSAEDPEWTDMEPLITELVKDLSKALLTAGAIWAGVALKAHREKSASSTSKPASHRSRAAGGSLPPRPPGAPSRAQTRPARAESAGPIPGSPPVDPRATESGAASGRYRMGRRPSPRPSAPTPEPSASAWRRPSGAGRSGSARGLAGPGARRGQGRSCLHHVVPISALISTKTAHPRSLPHDTLLSTHSATFTQIALPSIR